VTLRDCCGTWATGATRKKHLQVLISAYAVFVSYRNAYRLANDLQSKATFVNICSSFAPQRDVVAAVAVQVFALVGADEMAVAEHTVVVGQERELSAV
jgi:hypothetical protein